MDEPTGFEPRAQPRENLIGYRGSVDRPGTATQDLEKRITLLNALFNVGINNAKLTVNPAQRPPMPVQPAHARRLRIQLAALDTAHSIRDMDVPGFRLHQLEGKERGRWSIWVNGNWRLTFAFEDGNAYLLDYEDYH